MAKVKITGHASGSGVFTITAPNSNTDRTITLPDASVTLGTDATKLPLAGGALTGALTTNSTIDGRDVAADGVLATNALPKGGGTMTGHTLHGDNVSAKFGTGNDLIINHDGSNSYIEEGGTGDLILKATSLTMQSGANENYIRCIADGAVYLYHNNILKFETTEFGAKLQHTANTNLNMESGGASAITFEDVNTTTIKIHTNSTDLRWKDEVNNDPVMQISQAGNLVIDGSYSTSGVDYAEFFESTDGNAIAIGSSVVLENGKVKLCPEGETPLGVVRPNSSSSTIGGEHLFSWQGKYLKDDYDAYLTEDKNFHAWKDDGVHHQYYEDELPDGVTVPAGATTTVQTRKKLNSSYDEAQEEGYVPRQDRPEWNVIGLLGQVPITKGQPTAATWIKMKDVSDTVEMWFVK